LRLSFLLLFLSNSHHLSVDCDLLRLGDYHCRTASGRDRSLNLGTGIDSKEFDLGMCNCKDPEYLVGECFLGFDPLVDAGIQPF
jgi:hypothetical protein